MVVYIVGHGTSMVFLANDKGKVKTTKSLQEACRFTSLEVAQKQVERMQLPSMWHVYTAEYDTLKGEISRIIR